MIPRIPLEGELDLTYRCNNVCRHCWLWLPENAPARQDELSFDEICRIVEEARAMGCRRWGISGGEPMLREDFSQIFDYICSRSASYSLNTNGTLITPEIAQKMKRPGVKMVALYGATADVYERVSRVPGSFEAAMRGFAYLKEAGTRFTVQMVLMRENYHQRAEMEQLALSLSSDIRMGASWLYLSASGAAPRNHEIIAQRMEPGEVLSLDLPDPADRPGACYAGGGDGKLVAGCASRNTFHVDPYGQMSFCSFIKDPSLRYDLRRGTFREGWDEFFPAAAARELGGRGYQAGCGSCENRAYCQWCAAYAYLENRNYDQKVPYLCALAAENRRYQENWLKEHRRYYQIAGVTVQVDSDLPVTPRTFHPKLKDFERETPGEDLIQIRHRFSLPDLNLSPADQPVYRKSPWEIYRKGDSWVYLLVGNGEESQPILVGVFNGDYTRGTVYHASERIYLKGKLESLSMFATDQILLAQVMADREGCYFHSSGAIINGQGFLFTGHSGAGKSTMIRLLGERGKVLCDDRNIVRRWPDGFRLHGTWSHGQVPVVSSDEAPLRAILLLEKAKTNQLVRIEDRREIVRRLPLFIIKPLVTAEWWNKIFDLIGSIAVEVPCYRVLFDKSGAVVDLLEDLSRSEA